MTHSYQFPEFNPCEESTDRNRESPHQGSSTPPESLGDGVSIRWTPTDLGDLRARAKMSGQDFNPFIREITQIGKHYSTPEIKQLIEDRNLHRFVMENRSLLVKFIEVVRKS